MTIIKNYSLSEISTNNKWIDDKNIYSIVLPVNASASAPYSVDVSSLDIDSLININVLGHDRGNTNIVWCYKSVGNIWSRTVVFDYSSGLIIINGYYNYFPPDYLLLEYTKSE